MALLNFDERNFTLNAVAGALEPYKPAKEVKTLNKRIEKFREQASALHVELQAIKDEVRAINETKYPQLKEMAEKQAEQQNAEAEAKK
jgi:cystathionine beta-lyase/cystathionine gamma-synthase